MVIHDPTTWPLWLIIVAGMVVGLILLFILLRIFFHLRHKKDVRFLKSDFTQPDKDKPIADRISIYNLFWDLGANEEAFKVLHDLGITSWKRRKFHREHSERVSKLVLKARGYHPFVQVMLKSYSLDGISAEMAQAPTSDKKLEVISARVTQVSVDIFKDMGISANDAPLIGKKIGMSSVYAVGDMSGIPLREMTLIANVPKMKNMAMIYYRVNRQSGTKTQAIFRTAEEMATSIAAGAAGGILGFMGGAAVAEAGISSGAFSFLDIGGDGFDDIEIVAITIALGALGSIITGKFFKGVANWWNTRTLRKLQAAFNRECASVYSLAFNNDKNLAVVNKNLNIFVEYWQDRFDTLSLFFKKSEDKLTRLEKILLDEVALEIKSIYAMHEAERNRFLESVEKLQSEYNEAEAGRLLLFHRNQLFRGLEREISPYIEKIKTALKAVNEEVKNLKAKGKLPEPVKSN